MDSLNFTAVDFETICHKEPSWDKARFFICQIGIVVVRDGQIVEKVQRLVKPPYSVFDNASMRVHHIHPEDVADEPTFEELWPSIMHYFCNTRLVAHNKSTEENILRRYIEELNLMDMGVGPFDCTCKFYKNRGLAALCAGFGIEFNEKIHHDALYDAEKCALIALHMYSGDQPDWSIVDSFTHKKRTVSVSTNHHERISGALLRKDLSGADPNNPFYDRKVVVTGTFAQSRGVLAEWLKSMGADIDTNISKRTNFVLMGDDPGEKKVENLNKLIFNGFNVRVLKQYDVDQIMSGVYEPYIIEKINDKKLDFTIEHFKKHHLAFTNSINVIASKELYICPDVKGDKSFLRIVLGNLGAFDSINLCRDTNVCVMSADTVEQLKKGIKDDTILYIEDFYNKNRAVVFDFTFITVEDIVDFCRERCLNCGDELTLGFLNKYLDSF